MSTVFSFPSGRQIAGCKLGSWTRPASSIQHAITTNSYHICQYVRINNVFEVGILTPRVLEFLLGDLSGMPDRQRDLFVHKVSKEFPVLSFYVKVAFLDDLKIVVLKKAIWRRNVVLC